MKMDSLFKLVNLSVLTLYTKLYYDLTSKMCRRYYLGYTASILAYQMFLLKYMYLFCNVFRICVYVRYLCTHLFKDEICAFVHLSSLSGRKTGFIHLSDGSEILIHK